jgi:hypothetical protein
MTYENIKLKKHDKFGEGEKESVIDPFLKSFIEKLALKYPQWTFEEVYNTANHNTKTYEAYRFNIVDKREVLGTIDKDYISGGGWRYHVDNHRISSMRERGSGMKTIHEDKAIKHVGKFFGKKNVNEKFTEATQVISGVLGQVHNQKRWDLSHKWDALQEHTQKFIYDNYAMFASTVAGDKKPSDNLEKLPFAIAEFSSVDAMQEALRKGDAYIVFIDGLNYSIQKGKEPLEIKTSEEMPDFMRRAVGLLKLVEDNQVIDGVGVRANETTFLVMPNNVS